MFHPSRMATKEDREKAMRRQERKEISQRELRDTLAKASFDKRLFDVTHQNPEALGKFLHAAAQQQQQGGVSGGGVPAVGGSNSSAPRNARSGSWAPALGYERGQGNNSTTAGGVNVVGGRSPTHYSDDDDDDARLAATVLGYGEKHGSENTDVGLRSYTLPVLRKIKPSSNVMVDGALATDATPYVDPPSGFIKSVFRTNLNNTKAVVTPRAGANACRSNANTNNTNNSVAGQSNNEGGGSGGASTARSIATAAVPPPPFTHHFSKPRTARERIEASMGENAILVRAEPYSMRTVRSAFRENVDRLPQMSARKLDPRKPGTSSPRKERTAAGLAAVPSSSVKSATDNAADQEDAKYSVVSSNRQGMTQAERSNLLSRPKVSSAARKQKEEETYRQIPKPPGGFAEDRGRGPSGIGGAPPFSHMTKKGGSRVPEIASGYFSNPVGATIREEYEDPVLSSSPSRDPSRRPYLRSPPKTGGLLGKPCYQAL